MSGISDTAPQEHRRNDSQEPGLAQVRERLTAEPGSDGQPGKVTVAQAEADRGAGQSSAVRSDTGVIVWSGQLEKDASLTIEGSRCSFGILVGGLPGMPVILDVEVGDVEIAETPSASNSWNRLVIRSRATGQSSVVIRWHSIH